MTRHETVQAYLSGGIDRREFVRRLTIAGVSTAAALTYAQSLSSSASAAPSSRGSNGIARFADSKYSAPTLPNTGTGDSTGDSDSRTGLIAALAAAGAGVALFGRKLRRTDAEI